MDQVLVMAPFRQDGEYLRRLVVGAGSPAFVITEDVLPKRLEELPGVLLATHEALTPQVRNVLAKHLDGQPSWSELPVVVLLDRVAPVSRIRALLDEEWPRARLIFYQRPLTRLELISGIQSALLSRLHQREVRDHIAREMELRRELNHRVKNLLTNVTSIFAMTRRSAATIEELSADFGGRLRALANVHAVAHEADDVHVPLSEVARVTLRPYVDCGDRIVIDVAEVMLGRDAATTLALCMHELATNAIKYGALSVPDGRIELRAHIAGTEPELTLTWHEADGPVIEQPGVDGYGTRYIRASLAALFGRQPEFDYAQHGLRFSVAGPLERLRQEAI